MPKLKRKPVGFLSISMLSASRRYGGSTCTGFDVTPEGEAMIGGSAMTKEYTTIIHELLTDTYCVFFGDRPCYKVDNPSEDFYKDMLKRQMVSLSEAKNRY